jgi:putative ABC transport system permease protein
MPRLIDDLRRDLRYALRGMARTPAFAIAVILTLGLGIGANAAMFGVVDRLLFRPYPMLREPGEVHRVYLRSGDGREVFTSSYFEYTRYLDLRRWTTAFDEMAAVTSRTLAIGVGEAVREHRVGIVSAQFFSFFDAPPALGRYFTAEEDQTPRGADVVVLGYDHWQREFGGADVRGQTLRIGNQSLTVIGVASKGFVGLNEATPPAAYIPITAYAGAQRNGATYFLNYNWSWFEVMARRKPGVTVEQASADLGAAYARSYEAELALSPQLTPIATARPEGIAAPMRPGAGPEPSLEARTAVWVSGVALIVLLIACANVANLFLARALRRQRETAVRVALGVDRGRLARQVLTEGLVYATFGAIAGLFVAQWGGAGIRALLVGTGTSRLGGDVLTDPRTLAVSGIAALLTGVLTALVPALLAGRTDLSAALKAGAREGAYQRSRVRTALLLTQFALSFVLLVGAGLFVRSLQKVEGMRVGFDYDRLVLVEPAMRGIRLPEDEERRLTQSLLEAAQAYPGVEAAAAVNSIPFWSTSSRSLFVPGIDSVRRLGRFTYQVTTPDYFRTSGTRILRGRGLEETDRFGGPLVVVVSDRMARVLWPERDAIGACLKFGADTMPCSTVVGIAEDITQQSLTEPEHQYYIAAAQHPDDRPYAIYARFTGDPVAQQEGLRRALQGVMPGESYVTTRVLADLVRDQQGSWRLGATMFAAFGVLALVVAGVGLYGVIGYTVTQRLHEMGVRIALGARAADILRLVVGQSLRLATIGVGAGMLLALGAARWIEPLLFRQEARDPAILIGVAVLLLLVTLAASAAPAWRAIRADPATVLRAE